MKKRMAAIAVGSLFVGTLFAAPATASESHCIPFLAEDFGCWVKCNVNYFAGLPGQLPTLPPNGCTHG